MAKGSAEGAAAGVPTNTAYLTLWLGGDEHHIHAWKLPIAKHPSLAGIERGQALFAAVPKLQALLSQTLQAVRASGSPATVLLPTPLGPLPCFCTPTQPEPHADPIICAIPLAFFTPSKDYSAQRHANAAREQSVADLTQALETLPVLVLHLDLAARVVSINAPLRDLLGSDVGQVLPLSDQRPHPTWHQWENDAPYRWCDLPPARVLRDHHPIEAFMLHTVPATGEHTPFLAKAHPTYDTAGAVSGVTWVLIPITTKVYADGLAQRRAADILSVVESMRDGIMLYDAQGKLWQMNPAAREMLGWDRLVVDPLDTPLGARMRAYAPQNNDGRPLAEADWPMWRALHGENTEVVELSMKRMDSVRINTGISASPLRDDAGTITGAVEVIRDMTLHHRFEKMREGFMSLASHELRTPLTSLVLAQRIMQSQLIRSNAQPSLLDLNSDLLSQLRHLNRLVDNMLDMTGLTGGQFELRRQLTDIVKIVHDVIAELKLLHKRTPRDFIVNGFDEPLWLDVDPLRLSQVLYNLIANAIKFSPAEKPIEVEAHYFPFDDAPWFSIDIIDAGVGIPEEQMYTLFDRVIELEEVSRSSGMGYSLYLSRAIMQKHGGTIIANSVVNLGSTFSVRLPLPLTIEDNDA
ncbi:MAG: PAS domain-containing protein [Ktedonobacterales bacterium]|nr:PAS domain-containing protein [Ktedonobacterales bacterium]